MILSTSALRSYIQGIQFSDPRLYDVLMALVARLDTQQIDIQTLQSELVAAVTGEVSDLVPAVTVFEYTLFPDYVSLTWEEPESTASSIDVANYEIRKGSDWSTAVRVLVTSTLSAKIDPLTVGSHTYLIKSIGSNGFYTTTTKSLTVLVPAITAVSILSNVIDNNVLLFWSAPVSSFRILHYKIKRNDVDVGTKDGTFTTYFEQVAGTYKYTVIAVDIAGNESAASDQNITVNQPPDYVLRATITDDLSGTKVRTILDLDGTRLICNYVPETWEEHFVLHSWITIQDQIDAGYPYYLQPTAGTGTYTQTFDFGVILTNTIISLTWTTETIDGSMNISASVETSEDNITWEAPVIGTSVYAASVRYVRTTITFTANS